MSPLREAKKELDELTAGQAVSAAVVDTAKSGTGAKEVTKKLADQVIQHSHAVDSPGNAILFVYVFSVQLLNLVPPLGKAYYATPQVDYGPAYSPSAVASSK
jgi:hypothetical protein